MGLQQQTIAAINEHIRDFADRSISRFEVWEFFCECGCFELVPMTIGDYDAGRGVWAVGHGPLWEAAAT